MINKKYAQPLFMILMSFGMSVIIGGVVTLVHTGFENGFFDRFFRRFDRFIPKGLGPSSSGLCCQNGAPAALSLAEPARKALRTSPHRRQPICPQ